MESTTLLSNGWVIGIGGGIVSGLIVFFVTRLFIGSREDRLRKQRIDTANYEILYSIKPLLAEEVPLDQKVFRAILSATARKHGVGDEELFSPKQLFGELIKEIMESAFINASTKKTYCDLAIKLAEELSPSTTPEAETVIKLRKDYETSRERLYSIMSGTMALFTATFVTVASGLFEFKSLFEITSDRLQGWFPLALPLVASFIAVSTIGATYFMLRTRDVARSNEKDGATKIRESIVSILRSEPSQSGKNGGSKD